MRRILVLSAFLFAAACAPRPQAATTTPTPAPAPVKQSGLYGLTPQGLVDQFGKPALQIHEGNSVKLQFRGARCILDAYLYPSNDGQFRVSYVDTRTPTGASTDQAACIAALESAS